MFPKHGWQLLLFVLGQTGRLVRITRLRRGVFFHALFSFSLFFSDSFSSSSVFCVVISASGNCSGKGSSSSSFFSLSSGSVTGAAEAAAPGAGSSSIHSSSRRVRFCCAVPLWLVTRGPFHFHRAFAPLSMLRSALFSLEQTYK